MNGLGEENARFSDPGVPSRPHSRTLPTKPQFALVADLCPQDGLLIQNEGDYLKMKSEIQKVIEVCLCGTLILIEETRVP